ncbi:protoheme IX farnesyltransferase [candidate division GN15 bacterium]|nr:protoheme IX farnesyltransferase [candidate division GN15 bacterium]
MNVFVCGQTSRHVLPWLEHHRPEDRKATVRDYVALTKPTIMLLVIFTGASALLIEGSLLDEPLRLVLFLIGLYLTGGSANALNQYFERDIDARMSRTSKRRPLPQQRIPATRALVFSIAIGVVGVALLLAIFNWLTAALSLATILFYGFFYTLYLKPRTPQNIVIGGAAGAMAPVGAWAAATGAMAVEPWLMFLMVFLWTPPHFWALALYCKDDYVKAGLPMMPVVKGEAATLQKILVYSALLILVSLLPVFYGSGVLYLVLAGWLGWKFWSLAWRAWRVRTDAVYRKLFGYSIVYLFALFMAMIVDALLIRFVDLPALLS